MIFIQGAFPSPAYPEGFLMRHREYSCLLKWAGQTVKWFALTLYSYGILCNLLLLLDARDLAYLVFIFVGHWLWRLSLFVGAIVLTALFLESLTS